MPELLFFSTGSLLATFDPFYSSARKPGFPRLFSFYDLHRLDGCAIFPFMSNYYSDPAISHSMLKHMAKSPAHFKAELERPNVQTDAMLLGSLVHAMVLEPHVVEPNYLRAEKVDRRTKEGKAQWAAMQSEDKTLVKAEVWETAERMAESVLDCGVASSLVMEAAAMNKIEVEFKWNDNRFGVERKSKVDGITDHTIVDLKTTTDATRGFDRSVVKYWYHTQAAYYRDALASAGMSRSLFTIIAVEKTPPYAVAIVRMDDDVMDWGKEIVDNWLDQLRSCKASQRYPSFTGVRYFNKPAWAEERND